MAIWFLKPNIRKLKEKKDIEGLSKALTNKDLQVRKQAVEALLDLLNGWATESPEKALEVLQILEEAHWQPSSEIEEGAILSLRRQWYKLAEFGDERVIPGLLKLAFNSLPGSTIGDGCDAVRALGRIKSAISVQALKLLIESDRPEPIREAAVQALGQIRDFGATEILVNLLKNDKFSTEAAKTLAEIGWQPMSIEEKVNFFRAMNLWSEIEKLGLPAVKYLAKIVKQKSLEKYGKPYKEVAVLGKIGGPEAAQVLTDVLEHHNKNATSAVPKYEDEFPEVVAKSLGQIADKRSAETVIVYLFKHPRSWDIHHQEFETVFSCLFEDFTNLIIRIAFYDSHYGYYEWTYDLTPNLKALEEICDIHNPVSTNILHLVAERENFVGPVKASEWGYWDGEINLQPLRDMAKEELRKRGSPPYDKSAYLHVDNWRLKQNRV